MRPSLFLLIRDFRIRREFQSCRVPPTDESPREIGAVREAASADRVVLRPHVGLVRALAVRACAASTPRGMSEFGAQTSKAKTAESQPSVLTCE